MLPDACLSAVVEEGAEHSPGTTFSTSHTEPQPCQDAPLKKKTNDIFHNNKINSDSLLNAKIIANGNMYANLGCTLVQPG